MLGLLRISIIFLARLPSNLSFSTFKHLILIKWPLLTMDIKDRKLYTEIYSGNLSLSKNIAVNMVLVGKFKEMLRKKITSELSLRCLQKGHKKMRKIYSFKCLGLILERIWRKHPGEIMKWCHLKVETGFKVFLISLIMRRQWQQHEMKESKHRANHNPKPHQNFHSFHQARLPPKHWALYQNRKETKAW